MMENNGVAMIAKERDEQINKHGFTVEGDVEGNPDGKLLDAVAGLLTNDEDLFPWHRDIFKRLRSKPRLEYLAVLGAFIAAEIDRLKDQAGHRVEYGKPSQDNGSKSILQEAEEIVGGQRAIDYGDMTKSFSDIGKVWSVIAGVDITAHQVGLMMAGLKLVRENNSPKRDNLVDLAGYAHCTQMIVDKSDELKNS